MQEETSVRLMEHLFGSGAVEAIAKQLVRAMGVVEHAEEQSQAVVGPGHAAIAVLEFQLADLFAGQFLDEQRVDLVARSIDAVGQALVIRADAERAEREEAAVGQLVGVEQQLLAALVEGQAVVGRTRAAVMPGVFVTRRGARVIQIRPHGEGRDRSVSRIRPLISSNRLSRRAA